MQDLGNTDGLKEASARMCAEVRHAMDISPERMAIRRARDEALALCECLRAVEVAPESDEARKAAADARYTLAFGIRWAVPADKQDAFLDPVRGVRAYLESGVHIPGVMCCLIDSITALAGKIDALLAPIK